MLSLTDELIETLFEAAKRLKIAGSQPLFPIGLRQMLDEPVEFVLRLLQLFLLELQAFLGGDPLPSARTRRT